MLWQWPGDRDHSIIAGPLPPDEVGHRPLTARRPAGMSLLGPALHESDQRCTQTQAEALMPLSGSEVLAPV